MENDGRALGRRESLTCKAGSIHSVECKGSTLVVTVMIHEGRKRSLQKFKSIPENEKLFKVSGIIRYFQIDELNRIVTII